MTTHNEWTVPYEPDTVLVHSSYRTVDGIAAKHEIWRWDGVKGESLIFKMDSVSNLSDQKLEQLAERSKLVEDGSSYTVKRLEHFVFVNFNFVME